MSKKYLLPVIGLALCSVVAIGVASGAYATEPQARTFQVDFFNNYLREEFTLSSGTKGKGNNLLYKSVEAMEHALLEKPTDPVRARYDFQGWYLEEECKTVWNFESDLVKGNMRLFAKWGIAQEDEGAEPAYTPPSTVLPGEAGVDYQLESIMHFKVENNVVNLPTAAIAKLEANKDNVLPLMEYRVKASLSIAATYANNKITININGEQARVITVKDNSLDLRMDNSNYETKAKKYEANALVEESYHVMLAGSSSIEFWESSKEDLEPIVSYNHGIGGTTIEEWDTKLNQRLVFPYKPKMVVYYVGINNVINSKQDATTIWNNLKNFFDHTHEALPNTKVQYIMMNLIPGYTTYFDTINAVNANVTEYQKSNTWLTLINPGTALLKENGQPNAAYFRTDGLHLSYYGYVVWGGIIKQSIVKGLENN